MWALQSGILSREIYQEFLAVTVLSMVLTPFFMGLGYRSVDFSEKLPLPKILLYNRYRDFREEEQEKGLENHLIVIGFGINGRNVAIAAKKVSIPYIIIEINPETVRHEKLKGEPIIYGDAASKSRA